jgi:creatinine amidohydrolase
MCKPAQGWIMEFMTVQEMREALRETRTAILPIGVIEQHGYHLPLNTDVYNAYEIAKRVAAVASCVVAPPVNYSFSGGELPGTVDISPQTLSLLVMDLVKSLADQGFASVILLLGHGGSENQRAVLDAADMFLRRNRDFAASMNSRAGDMQGLLPRTEFGSGLMRALAL